ncbi:Lysophosphatidic acid:oleoyl-CoA acyltransferase 1 [Gnomoniopsis smithogilvyi]|uniref:Lysophosphatidic acid:oleoyl-CoA acyltransferase 1 n=1 Tax=Gnomoniopsis smithogilvyi TaxID=1191159 RepID=A0A9W8YS95_9PEZI|nr:Lysophosphatidic acid:oleoyl-CoA acyltransferase 1 [Gnomoniopsis smithogilvyi]
MEKFSQFRDRGSGISPFIPHAPPSSAPTKLFHLFLFVPRLFVLVLYTAFFLCASNIPFLPQALQKLFTWGFLFIAWIFWGDLQLDGVKRGSLSQQPPERMPGAPPASVIAASFTSPIDAVYLAAVFDPIFTISYPASRQVVRVGLWRALWQALSASHLRTEPEDGAKLTTVAELLAQNPGRVVAVFPECATTNGTGILPFSPSLLTVPGDVKIFPVSIRYTAPDITTPVPGAWWRFLWRLLSRPTHVMRIRIADAIYNTAGMVNGVSESSGVETRSGARARGSEVDEVSFEEQRVLDRVAETLARLGRNKRVGLTVTDKAKFVEAWKKK